MPWRLSTEMQLTRMNLMRLHQIVQFWLSIPIRDLSSHIITSYQLLDAMFGPQEHMTVDGLSKLKLIANDRFLQFPKPRHSGIRQQIATQMVDGSRSNIPPPPKGNSSSLPLLDVLPRTACSRNSAPTG